jgi:hypothetical protein
MILMIPAIFALGRMVDWSALHRAQRLAITLRRLGRSKLYRTTVVAVARLRQPRANPPRAHGRANGCPRSQVLHRHPV